MAAKARWLRFIIVSLISVPLFPFTNAAQSAQNVSADADSTDATTSKPPDCDMIDTDCLTALHLEPSIRSRILRSWQYQYQLQEQPAILVATTGSTTETIPNPNKWLQEHSIILQLSEWFPRSTNLPALIQAAYDDNAPDHDRSMQLGPDICGRHSTALECLASEGSWWGRMFSGAKVTFSVAQRDEVQQGILVPTLTASDAWTWGGEVDFDPTTLFLTSNNWKTAISALRDSTNPKTKQQMITVAKTAWTKETRPACIYEKSTTTMADCISEFTRPNLTSRTSSNAPYKARWGDFAAVVIPTFQLKVSSQFDFIKQGGILTSSPLLQRSLKNMTFTWDLRRLIAPTTDRLAIGTLYQAAQNPKDQTAAANGSSATTKLCVLRSRSATSYVSVSDDSNMNACRGLAVALGGVDHYAVACASEQIVVIGTAMGVNQPPAESNKPSTNCGWMGGGEVQLASMESGTGTDEHVVLRH
jgi:hypothetical protein